MKFISLSLLGLAMLSGCATKVGFNFSNDIYQGKNDPRHALYANPNYRTTEDHRSEGPMKEEHVSKPVSNSNDVPTTQESGKSFAGIK